MRLGTRGNALAMVGGVVLPDIPLWPGIGRFDIEISVAVAHDATVGSWGNWPGGFVAYLWAIDQDGAGGHPWTHVAEGIGWPAGWQDPEEVWGFPVRSMGIGLHFTPDVPVPIAPTSWGRVKQLYAGGR